MSDADASPPRGLIGRLRTALRLNGATNGHAHGLNGANGNGASPETLDRMRNAERFEGLKVVDVMVPRADIKAIDVATPLEDAARHFAAEAHSRMPVYRETLDDPVGLVHIKDVMRRMLHMDADGEAEPADTPRHDAGPGALTDLVRPVLFVPPSMRAADLLLRMRTKRVHMSVVVDEFGGTDGLVTLEDLVEEIVGDIADEHDDAEAPSVQPRGSHCWDAEARASIEDLEAVLGERLPMPEEAEDVDTLGGLVFTLAGRVPERGEVIRHDSGLEFEVVDADPRRIKRLLVRREPTRGELSTPASPPEPNA